MTMIHVLDDNTINKIAAGEVVERPASVIKELVENAMDAGATRIEVEIMAGGTSFMRVTDNGRGMSAEDAHLAILRHATSKIREVGDLNTVGTLGFRGEALPTIASVSRFTLLTRREGDDLGTRVTITGGKEPDGQGRGPLLQYAGAQEIPQDESHGGLAHQRFHRQARALAPRHRVPLHQQQQDVRRDAWHGQPLRHDTGHLWRKDS